MIIERRGGVCDCASFGDRVKEEGGSLWVAVWMCGCVGVWVCVGERVLSID